MVYMVGYDLNRPGQNYSALFEEIKTVSSNWWHNLDSTWIIVSNLTATQIRDRLRAKIDAGDELLVAKISAPAAWCGFSKEASDWLLKVLDG